MCSASKRQRQDASAKGAARSERPGAMRMARAVALALLGLCASAAWAQDGGVDRPAPIRTRPGMSTLAQDPAAGVMNLRERELRRRLEQRQAWARQGSESGR